MCVCVFVFHYIYNCYEYITFYTNRYLQFIKRIPHTPIICYRKDFSTFHWPNKRSWTNLFLTYVQWKSMGRQMLVHLHLQHLADVLIQCDLKKYLVVSFEKQTNKRWNTPFMLEEHKENPYSLILLHIFDMLMSFSFKKISKLCSKSLNTIKFCNVFRLDKVLDEITYRCSLYSHVLSTFIKRLQHVPLRLPL